MAGDFKMNKSWNQKKWWNGKNHWDVGDNFIEDAFDTSRYDGDIIEYIYIDMYEWWLVDDWFAGYTSQLKYNSRDLSWLNQENGAVLDIFWVYFDTV